MSVYSHLSEFSHLKLRIVRKIVGLLLFLRDQRFRPNSGLHWLTCMKIPVVIFKI